jgi:uncharacterized protein with HEPN domain
MSPRSERDWRLYAEDIVEACGKVGRYVAGMTFEAVEADKRTRDAVIRSIEFIARIRRIARQRPGRGRARASR